MNYFFFSGSSLTSRTPQRQTSTTGRVLVTAPPGFEASYPHRVALIFGVTQLVIGILCAVLNAPLHTEKFRFDVIFGYMGTGIWCGATVSERNIIILQQGGTDM